MFSIYEKIGMGREVMPDFWFERRSYVNDCKQWMMQAMFIMLEPPLFAVRADAFTYW